MDYRDKIISETADAECKKISRKVIPASQKRTDCLTVGNHHLLSAAPRIRLEKYPGRNMRSANRM
jgi:hypothetical protein